MNKITERFNYLVFFISIQSMVGCTHIVTPAKIIDHYPQKKKINLHVNLKIPESLKTAKIENNIAGDNWIIQLGDNLINNSEQMAKALFVKAGKKQGPDIVLMPRLASAVASHAAWIYDKSKVTLAMEWTVLDNKGATIWTETVKGEGISAGGSGFAAKGNVEKRADMAIKKLFLNSYDAIYNSPIIRHWERKNKKN